MMSFRRQAFIRFLYRSALLASLAASFAPKTAHAEKSLELADDWEVYTEGRVAAFASYVTGDGAPVAEKVINGVPEVLNGGLWTVTPDTQTDDGRTSVDMWRIRSGFLGNQLAVGSAWQAYA